MEEALPTHGRSAFENGFCNFIRIRFMQEGHRDKEAEGAKQRPAEWADQPQSRLLNELTARVWAIGLSRASEGRCWRRRRRPREAVSEEKYMSS